MRSTVTHHVALRVADLERATRFYVEALGAKPAFVMPMEGDFARSILPAPPETVGRAGFLTFDGGAIELFELSPAPEIPPADQMADAIMHLCLYVDDVHAALERVEAAGGRRRFPPRPFASHHFVYCEDPDGHIIELLDATIEECVALQGEEVPDITPQPGEVG
jgi:lactoylglutathione lyase